ncbi:MAG: methionine synthase [Candidatus Ventricola sp.]
MPERMTDIPLREALHFLGWRGTPLDDELLDQLRAQIRLARESVRPRVATRRFALEPGGMLCGTRFLPQGSDVRAMLAPCGEAVLMAATLGAASERLLLRAQARSAGEAVLMDAVLSAAIEAVCDEAEDVLRAGLAAQGKFLTDRFSPGYGDMPLEQTRSICSVLDTGRTIGLTVSQNGIMIPRKSVTAILGISDAPVKRRPSGCEGCAAKARCALRRPGNEKQGDMP